MLPLTRKFSGLKTTMMKLQALPYDDTDVIAQIPILRDLPGVNMIPCRKVDMYALIAGAAVASSRRWATTPYDTFFATPKGPLPAINSKMAHYALAGMAPEAYKRMSTSGMGVLQLDAGGAQKYACSAAYGIAGAYIGNMLL